MYILKINHFDKKTFVACMCRSYTVIWFMFQTTVKCDVCNLEFASQTVLDSHVAGYKHQRKVCFLFYPFVYAKLYSWRHFRNLLTLFC